MGLINKVLNRFGYVRKEVVKIKIKNLKNRLDDSMDQSTYSEMKFRNILAENLELKKQLKALEDKNNNTERSLELAKDVMKATAKLSVIIGGKK